MCTSGYAADLWLFGTLAHLKGVLQVNATRLSEVHPTTYMPKSAIIIHRKTPMSSACCQHDSQNHHHHHHHHQPL